MLYLVKARPIFSETAKLWRLLNDGTIEAQEPDGREIVASMRRAVIIEGKVEWQETCYCSPPLRHERATIYDQFFTDMEIEPLDTSTALDGESFWHNLEHRNKGRTPSRGENMANMARYVPVRIF
jgi:hypothetical protein